MFLETVVVFNFVFGAYAAATNDSYKDQFCTDPRTMKRHAAYTEWADAYSCTRHRCQPGGRNLAIYTVGCKRVEAPESAIECEEVVEDTNMQFPYCCTRLRCLVVVRGEVWTRVLGQPWETLPAAPWSHMYKMKRPPPSDEAFITKHSESGPVYELTEPETKPDRRDNSHMKPRGNKKPKQEAIESKRDELEDFESNAVPRASQQQQPAPDIVIALATTNDLKQHNTPEKQQKSRYHPQSPALYYDEEKPEEATEENLAEVEDNALAVPEKPNETDDKLFSADNHYETNSEPVTTKTHSKQSKYLQAHQQVVWNDVSTKSQKVDVENENLLQPLERTEADPNSAEKKEEKPGRNLQALVDAIGSRMRDIEHVVHKMSEKVQQAKNSDAGADENRPQKDQQEENSEPKPLGYVADLFKRFSVKGRGSKYLRSNEPTTDHPAEDESGYFSDVSNSLAIRRTSEAKEVEPVQSTYMAPVESRRKASAPIEISGEEVSKKKKKKKQHHKKHSKKGGKRKKKDNRKKFNNLSLYSKEVDRTEVSLEAASGSVQM